MMTRLPLVLLAAPLLAGFQEPPQLECSALPRLLGTMEVGHYAREAVAPVVEGRAVEQYLRALDPAKTVFLESEVERFKKALPQVFVTMRDGSCAPLEGPAALTITRAQEDEALARQLLGDKYVLDESVQLELDVKKRGYAKDDAERKARVAKLIHFQISNQLLTGVDLPTARKRVLHRYELATKRISERREARDVPELFAEAFAVSLDPHSSFFSAKALEDFRIHMRLSLEGIGAVLRGEDGFTVIQSIVPGGAADKDGRLRPKDKIVAVAQPGEEPISTIDMDLQDVVQMIRGKKGTTVHLTVLRDGKDSRTFDVSIVRDKVDVKEQAAKITYETRTVGKKTFTIGVLDLPSFYGGEGGRSALEDVRDLLKEAKKKGVDGLVLDLSENGGGLLEYAVKISGLFMQTGAIVATKGSDGDVEVLADEDDDTLYNGPVVVLVSPVSASASEILAGALQDYGRAVIAGGEHSFGKGTVQQLQGLPGGIGGMKLTMGMFFRPSGSSTQQVGVRSDVVIPSVLDGYDIAEADLDYSLPPQSIPPFLSRTANASSPSERFRPVAAPDVVKLAAESKKRVAKDETLQKIVKDLAEDKKEEGAVRLGDLRKKAEKNKDFGDEEAGKAEYEKKKKAFIDEGVNIAVDLIGLGQRP